MNTTTKITDLPQIVSIPDGRIITPGAIETRTGFFHDGKQRDFFYTASQMTAKGVPDKRQRANRIGVEKHGRFWDGCYALHDAARETAAQPIRDEIAQLQRKLADAKDRLMTLYGAEAC